MAIVAHYVTNDGALGTFSILFHSNQPNDLFTEELLIDFRELIGEHSGENMAEAVWATMELYGLVGKVSFLCHIANATCNFSRIHRSLPS
jgi:hypothetical protein